MRYSLEERQAITGVSVDMWGGFTKVIQTVFPNARIVYDKFHVIKILKEELKNVTCYTDFWQAYTKVIPEAQHRPVGKESGETNHIEHLNNTFRQRLSRLVRRTLSFSKSFFNLRSAVWNFIHYYNAQLANL